MTTATASDCIRYTERGGLTLECRADGEWYVFTGSSTGEHRLCRGATPEARLDAHWTGYVAAAVGVTRRDDLNRLADELRREKDPGCPHCGSAELVDNGPDPFSPDYEIICTECRHSWCLNPY